MFRMAASHCVGESAEKTKIRIATSMLAGSTSGGSLGRGGVLVSW